MKKIEKYRNWGDQDMLDRHLLVEGEVLRVQWPNGECTIETIKVKKGTTHYSDHGHPGTGPDDRAYIDHEVRGFKVQLYLFGLHAERLKAPKGERR